jgi:hypothetical protein
MSTPPAALSRVAALQAAAAGRTAAAAGTPDSACPYPQNGSLRERFMARYWRQGHAAGGPGAGGSTRP